MKKLLVLFVTISLYIVLLISSCMKDKKKSHTVQNALNSPQPSVIIEPAPSTCNSGCKEHQWRNSNCNGGGKNFYCFRVNAIGGVGGYFECRVYNGPAPNAVLAGISELSTLQMGFDKLDVIRYIEYNNSIIRDTFVDYPNSLLGTTAIYWSDDITNFDSLSYTLLLYDNNGAEYDRLEWTYS
jgi:hypothetical protein